MLSGRYVIVQLNSKTNLNFQEVKAFGRLAKGKTTAEMYWVGLTRGSALKEWPFTAVYGHSLIINLSQGMYAN